MCGIVGFSSKSKSNTDKLALLMYHNSVSRGTDNTGFYTPEEGIKKNNIKAEDFLLENPIPKSNVFIGHVRRSSVGGKLAECSHPFEEENLILVHNGTLTSYIALATKHSIQHQSYKVDSQVLAKVLDKNSKEDVIIYSGLSEFEGAAAILFADKRDKNSLFAYTNGDRPLFYGMIEQSIYISSTEESLKLIQAIDIKPFEDNFLYQLKFGKIVSKVFYAKKIVTNVSSRYNLYQGEEDYWEDLRATSTMKNIGAIKFKDTEEAKNLVGKSPNVDEYDDKWILCKISYNNIYGKNNSANIKKDKWYLCNDVSENNFDIMLEKDETNTAVTVNKYLFDQKYLDFRNYGVMMEDVKKASDKSVILFKKGDIVETPDYKKSNKTVGVYHESEEQIYYVPTTAIRTVTNEELIKIENDDADKTVAELNNSSMLPVLIKKEDEKFEDAEIIDEAPILKEDEKLASFIIDVLSDKFEDIEELSDSLSFDELKKNISEFRELMNEAYNFKVSRELMFENENNSK